MVYFQNDVICVHRTIKLGSHRFRVQAAIFKEEFM